MPDAPPLPPWPDPPPAAGSILLRPFTDDDVACARELSTDPYVPLIGTLPPHATEQQAREWLARQHARWTDGVGYSFAVAAADTGRAVGSVGLWLRELAYGRASAGYSVAPSARGNGVAAAALRAVTGFAWTLPALHRIHLHIEPWNVASIRTAERAGYEREGLLRSHQEIGGRRRDMLLYAMVRPAEASPS